MTKRLSTILCVSALCLGLGVMPTQAGQSRLNNFNLICDGTVRTVNFVVGGFPASTNQFILGGAVAVANPRDGIKSLRVMVAADPTKVVLIMGNNETAARFAMPSFYQVPSNAAGNIGMQIIGACSGGGAAQGLVELIFN
jgi:hypothetical protein